MMHIPRPVFPTAEAAVKKIVPITPDQAEKMKRQRDLPIVFSFQHFDRRHELFNLGGTCLQWFASLSDILSELSKSTISDLYGKLHSHYEPHQIDWGCTNAKFDFDDAWIQQHDCIQIRLSAAKGRIHGFIVGNCFYIVWLDPHHNLWVENKDKSYGGPQKFPPLQSCVEEMSNTILDLRKELIVFQDLYDNT